MGRAGLDQKCEIESVELRGRVLRGVGHADRTGSNRDQIRRGRVEERHDRRRNQGCASLWHRLWAVARGRARKALLPLMPWGAAQLGTAAHGLGIQRGRGQAVGDSREPQGCRDEYAENSPAKHAVLTVRAAEPCVKRAEPVGPLWSTPVTAPPGRCTRVRSMSAPAEGPQCEPCPASPNAANVIPLFQFGALVLKFYSVAPI